jgi:hypothetical protein
LCCSRSKRLGKSDLRDLLLRKQGYKVLPLPYYEWAKLPCEKAGEKNGDLTAVGMAKFEAWLMATAQGKQLF